MSKQKEKNDVSTVQGNACQRGRSSSTTLKDTLNHNDHSNSLPTIHTSNVRRKAIDWIGRVGHQYDASQDKVIKNFRLLENSSMRTAVDIPPSCIFIRGELANDDTLLKILDIDDQSILNLLLNTTTNFINGTHTALFNSRQWFDNRKRILFYRRIYEKETLPLKPKWNYLEKNSLHQNATHIITSISSGIELLIVLDVPSELPIQDIDEQLSKLCMIFRTGRRLADHDTLLNYLDQLKIITTYTNIAKLASLKSISAAYERICKIKIRHALPIFYYLQPISSIYQQVNIIYRKINYVIIYSVQAELLILRRLIDEVYPLLTTSNKSKLHQQFEELKQRYSLIQQSLTFLMNEIQRGRKNEHELAEYFLRTDYRSLIIDTQKLVDNIQQSSSSHHGLNLSSQSGSSQNSIETNDINVLLLGETGVGKSTFINALANYIRFESLKQVGENDPIVLIPTSFLITTRTIKRTNTRITDFNEITIRFGNPDPNELHNDQGQSVTQQCKSYSIPTNHHTKLNIIDTPGIGDTRGLKQDKINIQDISSFVQKLSHLNAICILLKPNVERLHASFRLYLMQLFNILHPNMRKNIIFCFTNARSTLYMPGNTVPLLDELLKQLPGDRVVFNNSNTFCFDSESFRFLAATKQGIKFSEQQDREYQQSWVKSATETDRFYKYIQSLKTCWINTNAKLIQEAETTSCLF
jgi:GTP-binding protein EngB required for normal cell division